MSRPGRERRIESASATITRLVRRRNTGYQRVDPDDLREGVTAFTARFYDAVDGGPVEPLDELIAAVVRKRLQQGLHPLEVFGAWREVRRVLESVLCEEAETARLLDLCEQRLIEYLQEGVSLRPPYTWPGHEVQALRRDVERLRVGLQLIERSTQPLTPAAAPVALTRREREILTHAAGGMTTDEIASTVGISRATVRTYMTRAVEKLGATNRTHAIALAVGMGIVIAPEPENDVADGGD